MEERLGCDRPYITDLRCHRRYRKASLSLLLLIAGLLGVVIGTRLTRQSPILICHPRVCLEAMPGAIVGEALCQTTHHPSQHSSKSYTHGCQLEAFSLVD
jgi:hypothetical protein